MIVTSASAPAFKRALGNPEKLRRVACQLAQDLGPGQMTRFDQARDRDRNQGLQADDSEGAWSISFIFFSRA